MSHLTLVVEEHVPVEELKAGDRLILPNGRRVTVHEINEFKQAGSDELIYIVVWKRPSERGEPGHPGGRNLITAVGNEYDGFCYGGIKPLKARDTLKVDRAGY